MNAKGKALPRAASPKEAGVATAPIQKFLEYAREKKLEFHSLMVLRRGRVAVEWYNEPYNAETKHTMYSISKSFTSTAVGFAVSEGLLSLDDRVLDFFPDCKPKKNDPYFDRLTVRTLLTMTSGKQPNMVTGKGDISDWVEDYINSPWVFEPGTRFLYVNENIYMLCAILCRLTKTSVTEYLRPRLFEPLGIEDTFWETDAGGVEAGGWGLYIRTEDLAKVADCYLHGGKYAGKQVIPGFWTEEATKNQLGHIRMTNFDPDCCAGYGYCFWMDAGKPFSYRMDGMFSQCAVNYPELDATVVATAGIPFEDRAREALSHAFPAAFLQEEENPAPLSCSSIGRPAASRRSPLERTIEGRTVRLYRNLLLNLLKMPLSVLPLPSAFMMSDRAGNIDNVRFDFGEKECSVTWDEGDENNTVICGMDGHYRYGKVTLGTLSFTVCADAAWTADDRLRVTIRPLETIGPRSMSFRFLPCKLVTMKPSSTPSIFEVADLLAVGVPDIIKNPILARLSQLAMRIAPFFAEPKQYGRFLD